MIGGCTDDGECVGSPEPAPGDQWNGEGHPDAIPPGQAQVKSKDRSAKRGVGSPCPQPKSDGNLERGPCENQESRRRPFKPPPFVPGREPSAKSKCTDTKTRPLEHTQTRGETCLKSFINKQRFESASNLFCSELFLGFVRSSQHSSSSVPHGFNGVKNTVCPD